jgi:AraC-like DNA-binding protein
MSESRTPSAWKVPVQILLGIARLLEEQGVDVTEWLNDNDHGVRILETPNHRLSIHQHLALFRRAISLAQEPGLGLDVGHRQTPSDWGILGYAINCCANVREAFALGARYSRIASSFTNLQLVETRNNMCWQAIPPLDYGDVLPFIIEFEFASFFRCAQLLTGRSDGIAEIQFAYPPPVYSKRYGEFFPVRLKFGATVNQVVLEPQSLLFPILQASTANRGLAEKMCQEYLERQPLHDDLASEIRDLLLTDARYYPDAELVARALHMTSRTLRKKLALKHTSFQRILDDVRARRAKEKLANTRMKVEEIAWDCDFADVPSFRRAFKKWTGLTPVEYRQQQRAMQN